MRPDLLPDERKRMPWEEPNNLLRDLCIAFFIGPLIVMLIVYIIALIGNEFNV